MLKGAFFKSLIKGNREYDLVHQKWIMGNLVFKWSYRTHPYIFAQTFFIPPCSTYCTMYVHTRTLNTYMWIQHICTVFTCCCELYCGSWFYAKKHCANGACGKEEEEEEKKTVSIYKCKTAEWDKLGIILYSKYLLFRMCDNFFCNSANGYKIKCLHNLKLCNRSFRSTK